MTSRISDAACAGARMSTSAGEIASCRAGLGTACLSIHKAMACVLLIVLHLALTSLATVRSSIMPYGAADGSVFVEQHPHLYQNFQNVTCEEFVYRQARGYAKVEFARTTSTIRSFSKMFMKNILRSSEELPPPSLDDVIHSSTAHMDEYIYFLRIQDHRIREVTFTLKLKSKNSVNNKNSSDVILFLKSGVSNSTWNIQRNWERTCHTNYSSQTGLNFDAVIQCTTKARETHVLNEDSDTARTGNVQAQSQDLFAMSPDGYWNVYCSRTNSPSTVDSLLYIYELVDEEIGNSNQSKQGLLRGTITIRFDVNMASINQCNTDGMPNLLKHKCQPSTKCVHIPSVEKGITFGSYNCVCDKGTTNDDDDNNADNTTTTTTAIPTTRYFPGIQLERAYHSYLSGTSTAYERSFKCLPCEQACLWPLCLDHSHCAIYYGLEYKIPILVITSGAMVGVIVLMALTFKFRNEKMMRASTPGLLFVTLLGAFLLYTDVIITAIKATNTTCMLRPWVRHIGFSLAYGGLLFKTWRISVIMRVFKSRAFKTRDSELYKKVTLLTTLWIIFLILWTVIEPLHPLPAKSGYVYNNVVCNLSAWNFAGYSGELILLLWGASLCYQARRAPDLYNETRQVSYALWNEGIWEILIIIARFLLLRNPDANMLLLIRFLRSIITVTAMLILVFTPKFIIMFRKIRQVHGTLTDVYGSRRVHRLSLMVNKHGDIKTIYCTPCGPLAYLDQSEQSDSSSRESNKQNLKEDEYSKAEVDSLIELVSRLKSERELYKMQVKRLLQLLRSTKRKPNGLSPSLVAEDPDGNRRVLDLSTCDEDYNQHETTPVPTNPAHGTTTKEDLEEAQLFQCSASAGPRNSRASTMTTFVSSSTPDDASLTEVGIDSTFPPPSSSNTHHPHHLPLETDSLFPNPQGSRDSSPPCKNCNSAKNGISRYALTVLARKLAQNHVIGKDLSPEAEMEDFPRMLHSHEETCNNNRLSMKDFIPTVYGDFCDTLVGQQNHRELQEMLPCTSSGVSGGAGGVHRRTLSSESGESSGRRQQGSNNTTSEKLNFIMYI